LSFAPPEHWDLVDLVAVVSKSHKPVGSTEGHTLAGTSPLQTARLQGTEERLERCRRAILDKDFSPFAEVVELDSNLMHAVMLTSSPPLVYWMPATLEIMKTVAQLRSDGVPACFTIDAGPNVHVITLASFTGQVQSRLEQISAVQEVLRAVPGGPARLIDDLPSR
jgi:diphosphomevalonate decarboxylase